ncbi:hypothetical protein FOA43_000689 [Brettanomyces nanus]|uniref:Uncharacterized protein n=1 Tax=Eeniella nana TaxID=13502 RepID=A0A875S0H5_EENNA|nr:uncharacterized protein FOA43_000689 [Brettanomyces nanus]QPG73379.1 hypothetical protein FOA43_000689 [Brettanomyces nanus]
MTEPPITSGQNQSEHKTRQKQFSPQSSSTQSTVFDANFQNELDRMEAELQNHSKGKKSAQANEHGTQTRPEINYLESNLKYLDKLNDEELSQHLQKIIVGEDLSKSVEEQTDKAVQAASSASPLINKSSDALISGLHSSSPPQVEKNLETRNDGGRENHDSDDDDDDIDKELEVFQRVQEEVQQEVKRNGIQPLDEDVEQNTDSFKRQVANEGSIISDSKPATKNGDINEPVLMGKVSASGENNLEKEPGFHTTGTTTTYKGVSIPANSELVRSRESGVLKAYKQLLEGHETTKTHIDIAGAQLAALPLTVTAPEHLSFNVQMLINTLPVLDNLATQILRIISQGPFQKVMEIVANRDSYSGIAFGNMVELFETTKRIYNSEENPFFTVENVTFGLWKFGEDAPDFLKGKEETLEGTLRKVNLATFLLATLGLIDLGFFFLNEAFLDVFCPPKNLDPSKSISQMKQNDSLQSIMPAESSQSSHTYMHSQTKFLKSQAILYLDLKTQAFISAMELGDRSKNEIIQDLFPDNLDAILMKRKDSNFDESKTKVVRNLKPFTSAELDFLSRCDSRKKNLLEEKNESTLMEKYEWMKFLNDLLDYVSKNVGFLIWGPKGKFSNQLDKHTSVYKEIRKIPDSDSGKRKAVPEEGDTEASAKKKARQNRSATFRRTWTPEEENALRDGLKLKGTHWTAILELYGPGGSVNEALKNRTSLQLKDKARNWKLYFLKNDLKVPSYLTKATGGSDKAASPAGSKQHTEILEGTPSATIVNGLSKPDVTEGSSEATIKESSTKTDAGKDATDEFKNLVAQAFN